MSKKKVVSIIGAIAFFIYLAAKSFLAYTDNDPSTNADLKGLASAGSAVISEIRADDTTATTSTTETTATETTTTATE